MLCQYCHQEYDLDDFTDESEACDDCCPDCLYSGNMFSPEEDDDMDPDEEDLYDDEELDESYDDIEIPDEEFDEEDITEEL